MNDPTAAGRFPAPPAELPDRIGDGRVGLAGEPGPDPDRAPIRFDWRRNLVLFLLTVASVSFVGYTLWGSPWQFAAALMAILVAHEFGHYVAARIHGVSSSLPYFLPLPIFNPFGTLGAVILMPDRIRSRRALLDIGAAGPLAGMVVALPLMLFGLSQSEVGPRSSENYIQEGQSLLYLGLKHLVHGSISADQDVFLHPVALAAWAGFFITFLNLLPVGQLDGGHVAYALLGERQNRLARWFFFLPTALLAYNAWEFALPLVRRALTESALSPLRSGMPTLVSSLLVWVLAQALLLVFRRRRLLEHPPVDEHRLSGFRKAVGGLTLALFLALFMPSPWVVF